MKKFIQKNKTNKNLISIATIVVIYLIIGFMLDNRMINRQITNMIIPISYYIVLAVSLNLVVGFLGELSLGHAGFMAVGVFTGALFSLHFVDILPLAIRLPLSMLIAGLVAAAVGLIVGTPALRLNGDYLAIVTLACGEIIKDIIMNLEITGGAMGLFTTSIKEKPAVLLPYAAVLVLLTVIVMINLQKSKTGRAIMAIRDNKIAAESMGINITYYKLLVFVIAAFFAGAAGALYSHLMAQVTPSTFNYNMSIEILVIVVLGGMGSVRGSIIAAILLQAIPEMLREFSEYRMLAYSILLVLIMIFNNNPTFIEFRERIKHSLKRNKEVN